MLSALTSLAFFFTLIILLFLWSAFEILLSFQVDPGLFPGTEKIAQLVNYLPHKHEIQVWISEPMLKCGIVGHAKNLSMGIPCGGPRQPSLIPGPNEKVIQKIMWVAFEEQHPELTSGYICMHLFMCTYRNSYTPKQYAFLGYRCLYTRYQYWQIPWKQILSVICSLTSPACSSIPFFAYS